MNAYQKWIQLSDWRRKTAELYSAIRKTRNPARAWSIFVQARDDLFKTHPQSPLDDTQRKAFTGLQYFDYNAAYCVSGRLENPTGPMEITIELGADGTLRMMQVAIVKFRIQEINAELSLFWIQGYGGGLFLPFRDTTADSETYGGGRYLFDTIKGADLESEGDKITLDFNFAYNPSCAYSSRWVCPLAPETNHINLPILAGEKHFA